jgi:2-polyprenyl-3-methyl-5-hydroxy-6-metoxy-1,4-benzoquinol methylase
LGALPGTRYEEVLDAERRKPFWNARIYKHHAQSFARIRSILEEHKINPPARLLELGCGAGWMAAWFAEAGYRVVGTDVAQDELQLALQRVANPGVFGKKGAVVVEAPMEKVHQMSSEPFDAVYVHEALHQASDWRAVLESARHCLKEGGILIVASEPNILHQFVAWKVVRISGVREVAFSRRALLSNLKAAGFGSVQVYAPVRLNPLSFHWVCAQV